MNLYQKAAQVKANYLAGNFQPGMGWLALRFSYRGEVFQLYPEESSWEVYKQTGQGKGKLCLTL